MWTYTSSIQTDIHPSKPLNRSFHGPLHLVLFTTIRTYSLHHRIRKFGLKGRDDGSQVRFCQVNQSKFFDTIFHKTVRSRKSDSRASARYECNAVYFCYYYFSFFWVSTDGGSSKEERHVSLVRNCHSYKVLLSFFDLLYFLLCFSSV